jgi:hypothetical protein
MTRLIHRTKPVTGHAYSLPVVRELPLRPTPAFGSSTW